MTACSYRVFPSRIDSEDGLFQISDNAIPLTGPRSETLSGNFLTPFMACLLRKVAYSKTQEVNVKCRKNMKPVNRINAPYAVTNSTRNRSFRNI
jgi:hypothetical protein